MQEVGLKTNLNFPTHASKIYSDSNWEGWAFQAETLTWENGNVD